MMAYCGQPTVAAIGVGEMQGCVLAAVDLSCIEGFPCPTMDLNLSLYINFSLFDAAIAHPPVLHRHTILAIKPQPYLDNSFHLLYHMLHCFRFSKDTLKNSCLKLKQHIKN